MTRLIAAALMTTIFSSAALAQVNVLYEQYALPNGLQVILHEDHSAPVVAVVVMYHVGSKNEKVKRTGFAHLFEHMMFQGSEHIGDDQHFKLLQDIGANINGTTNEDRTNYFEVIPSNYLELALYLESDRMGFLLPAMTQEKLDNQRDVVKNERRQRVDNVPYGTAWEKISKGMFLPEHPYSWPVIGYMDDLSAAAMEDVKDFFRTYYAPNNACLSIAGDFEPSEAKALVEKYFGEFQKGKEIERPSPAPAALKEDVRLVFEDKVQLPRLYVSWHGPKMNTREDAVLTVLGEILSAGKNSRLYKSLVYDKQSAQSVSAGANAYELSGLFQIIVTAKPEKGLSDLGADVTSIVNDVLEKSVTEEEIARATAGIEDGIVNSLSTVLGKANTLASYYLYTGDPGRINKEMELYSGITPDEIKQVAKKYLANPAMYLSIVPEGKIELAFQKAP